MFEMRLIRRNVNTSQRQAFLEGMASILDIGGVASPSRLHFRGTDYSVTIILNRRHKKTSAASAKSVLAGDLQRLGQDLGKATERFEANYREQLIDRRSGSTT